MPSALLVLSILCLALPALSHEHYNDHQSHFACPTGEYQVGTSHICAPCSNHCSYCSSEDACHTCEDGYELESGRCGREDGALTFFIVGAVVGVFGFVVCGCCFCCKMCRNPARTHNSTTHRRRSSSYDGFSVTTGDYPSMGIIHPQIEE